MMTFFIIVAAYFGVLIGLSALVRPHRRILAAAINELDNGELNEWERALLLHISSRVYSIRTAPVIMMAYIGALFSSADGVDAEVEEGRRLYPTLLGHPLMGKVLDSHLACGAAANPIFGALAYVARAMYDIRLRLIYRHGSYQAAEKAVGALTAARA